jgi:hypothetical protein
MTYTTTHATAKKVVIILLMIAVVECVFRLTARAEFPKPSPYPISWELTFQHDKPKRIVVNVPNQPAPVAYWYVTYNVTNNTGQEQTFLPFFEMQTNDGQVIRSDKDIPPAAFEAIKKAENKPLLEPWTKIGGELRLGDDESKDGVAIWQEPMPRMGVFQIYVGGLCGEHVELKDEKGNVVKDKDGNPVILRKTLELTYHIRGDEVYPGQDEVNVQGEQWIMR